jgi:hypothetical protein
VPLSDPGTTGAPPRRLIVLAAILAVALAAAVGLVALFAPPTPPPVTGALALPWVPAPQANSTECSALLAALPPELVSKGAKLARRELAQPAPPATTAWGEPDPIVLRCGVERPPELTPTSQLRVVSGVQWLPLAGQGRSTWYIVDRAVYVALTVPDSAGTGPLQQTSDTVAATLPAVPLRFG